MEVRVLPGAMILPTNLSLPAIASTPVSATNRTKTGDDLLSRYLSSEDSAGALEGRACRTDARYQGTGQEGCVRSPILGKTTRPRLRAMASSTPGDSDAFIRSGA